MKKKSNENLKNKYLLTGLSVFCVLLIILSFVNSDLVAPVKQISGYLVTPVQKGINSFGSWLSGVTDNFEDVETLREENESLKEQVATLTEENSLLIQDHEELERLQELYDLDKQYSEYEKVAANIIAKESGNWFNLFTIDKGSNDGIQKDMNVIADGGLVGIVTEVGANWATVRAIIDDESNVSAMVSTTSDQCMVGGDLTLIDDGSLTLSRLTDADNAVHVGDKVVTSYISENYLPGILIGYISELNNDSNNLTKSGYITPVVDFRHLQEVLVILELKDYVASDSDSEESQMDSSASETETSVSDEDGSETETESSDSGENSSQE
ncbi:MAG: rod shape-determining protein MreC [Lachnospiraceae bacterium]|nr:rod shape-determining protein MreC [Lachnospiraceae bacterium]